MASRKSPLPRLRMRPVRSSAIRAVGYYRPERWLFVHYRGAEGIYAYEAVTSQEWRDLLAAPSKGRFVNFRIKPHHPFIRLTP
jgi:hypothetical protein